MAQIESQIEEVETAKKKRKQDLLALTASKRTDTEKNESESNEESDSSSEKKSGGKKVIHDKVRLSFEYFSINCSQIMLNVILHQGPLSKLRNRKIAQHIQSNLVPWIVSKYGPLCRTGCSSQTVRNMLIAIIERDDLARLGTSIKTLAGRYKMAFDELAKKAWMHLFGQSTITALLCATLSWRSWSTLARPRTIAYVQACIQLAVTFQVPCLSMFYSTFIPDIYHLLGPKGGDVCARSDVSSIPRA